MALTMKATVNWNMYLDDIQDYFDNDAPNAWRRIFRPLLRALMIDHGKRIGLAFGLQWDVQMLQARNWFNSYVMDFWRDVVQTTRDTILTVVNQGITEGWSIDTMTNHLSEVFDAWINKEKRGDVDWSWYKDREPRYRLDMIARTETIRASNAGATELYKEWGVREHEWLSTEDDRTRRVPEDEFDHYHTWPDGPNKQVVAIGTPFTVSGESLMYPGDPAGSPGNTINCRCTTIPVIASDKALKGWVTLTDGEGHPYRVLLGEDDNEEARLPGDNPGHPKAWNEVIVKKNDILHVHGLSGEKDITLKVVETDPYERFHKAKITWINPYPKDSTIAELFLDRVNGGLIRLSDRDIKYISFEKYRPKKK